MEDRQEKIHEKGFDLTHTRSTSEDYSSIKVGVKNLDDAILNLGSLKLNRYDTNRGYLCDKGAIMKALGDQDIFRLREVSDYFYRTSGVYQKLVNYFASMYRYD